MLHTLRRAAAAFSFAILSTTAAEAATVAFDTVATKFTTLPVTYPFDTVATYDPSGVDADGRVLVDKLTIDLTQPSYGFFTFTQADGTMYLDLSESGLASLNADLTVSDQGNFTDGYNILIYGNTGGPDAHTFTIGRPALDAAISGTIPAASVVPIPAALPLLASGLGLLAMLRRPGAVPA
jgi:hypothetical protein